MSSLTPADIKQISDIIEKTSTKGKAPQSEKDASSEGKA